MAARKSATARKVTPEVVVAPAAETNQLGTLVSIPISRVDFDSFPNCRTGNWVEGVSSAVQDSGTSYTELYESIEIKGQIDPITVRPKANPKKGGPDLECIKGFRRGRAVKTIGEKKGNLNPEIKVIIKQLNDLEAAEENTFENTARDNLKPSDLAFAAHNLLNRYRAAGVPMSINQLAQRMGKNQSYMNQLVGIVEKVPEIATMWRGAAVEIPVMVMSQVARKAAPGAPGEVVDGNAPMKAFELAKLGKLDPKSGKPKVDRAPTTAAASAKALVEKQANLLGRLKALGHVTIRKDKEDGMWSTALLGVLGVKTGELTPEDTAATVAAGKAAYDLAIKATRDAQAKAKVQTTEDDESEES